MARKLVLSNPFRVRTVRGSRPSRSGAWVALVTLALAGSASAQERPSMADLQAQIDALEAAYCAQVNSVMAFCSPPPPSCPCNLGTPYPSGATCTEVAAGDYEVAGDVTWTASCAGQCGGGSGDFCNSDPDCTQPNESCFLLTNTCVYNVPGPIVCTSNADCPGTSYCITTSVQGTCTTSATTCFTNFDCPQGETCDGIGSLDLGSCIEDATGGGLATCTTSADCSPGVSCADIGDGTLRCLTGASCGTASCASGSYSGTLFSITNVGAAGSGEIATCDTIQVDADDALYCIGLIEADLGTSCVPYP